MHEELLKKCDVFSSLSQQQLQLYCVGSTLKHYQAGEIVYAAHLDGTNLFVVQSGLIQLNLTYSDRYEGLVGFIGKNQFGPSLEVILNKPLAAQATAASDTTVLVIPKDNFLRHYAEDAQLLHKLLLHNLEESYFYLKIYEMAISATSDIRIAVTLLSLYVVSLQEGENISYINVDFEKICQKNLPVELTYSQEALASMCAVTRQTLIVALKPWREKGWVEAKSKCLIIKNVAALVALITPEGKPKTQWRSLEKMRLKQQSY